MNVREQIESSSSYNKEKASRAANVAFGIGLFAPFGAICGPMVAFLGAIGEFLPMALFGLAFPFLICLAGIVFGIFGIKSKHRASAISGIVLSGLTLFLYIDVFFIPYLRG